MAVAISRFYLCITNMITNKYESPPNYQQRKQQRLRQIQEDYFPPPPDGFFRKFFRDRPLYIPCENYTNKYLPSPLPLHINYSRKSNYITIVIAFVFGAWPYLLNQVNVNADNVFSSIVVTGIIIGSALKQLLHRKPLMVISEQSFLFIKDNLEVAWEHIVAAHVLEEHDGDGTNYYIIIDYYDVYEDYFKVHRFAANNYDVNYEVIAATVAYCLKKAECPQKYLQNIPNLPIQAT